MIGIIGAGISGLSLAYLLQKRKILFFILEKENIFVCANWKDGVSVADCIKKAFRLADKLTA